MQRIGIGALALLTLLVTIGLLRGPQPARAQEDMTMGWLEGTVKDEDGKGMGSWIVGLFNSNGAEIQFVQSSGGLGGFYSMKDVKPGVYEVRVYPSGGSNRYGELLRQRHWNVPIKKGVRSRLDFKLKEGKSGDFEEKGQPNVPTQKVMSLTEEMANLKAEIAELKKQIEELKKK